ncbi:MAG: serine/threonine-protein kinase [Polyangiales bacterium]
MDTPARFGPYELVRRIGRGGMAETFAVRRADASGPAPLFCLKRVLPGLVESSELLAWFVEEARLSAQLHHANVVPVVDFGSVDGVPYLVLEHIDGVDLRALLSDARREGVPLPYDVVAEVARGVAFALDFAHACDADGRLRGLVHRDISPSNVLVDRHGGVKLGDFGIAKAIGSPQATRTGVLKGKIPYMAPEYAAAGRFDHRSDLFALGVTLYECVTLERPFDGPSDVETLERILDGQHVPLTRLETHVPPLFAECVERLLAVDPCVRFATARAFVEALAPCLPPSTARREVARCVERALAHRAERERIEPSTTAPDGVGTAFVDTTSTAVEAPRVEPAAPDAVTRTRAP